MKVFAYYVSAAQWLRENISKGWPLNTRLKRSDRIPVPKRTDVQVLVDTLLEARSIMSDYPVPTCREASGGR